uniref:Uncharacterized protein n=1 Tax=Anopheles albimanus TaxID=7167 RepID=A0A182FY82_ANOAL
MKDLGCSEDSLFLREKQSVGW